MSKINVNIPIKILPQEVLKELLNFCDKEFLHNKSNLEELSAIESDAELEFMYDYENDFTESQSNAIVFYASKENVEAQIEERSNY